ncbi:MAG: DUF4143 domain-containing protein [Dehalococcoidia bacterium]|nr:DUF4143 domain-containing protein [Dehalococcoidia bacterium]
MSVSPTLRALAQNEGDAASSNTLKNDVGGADDENLDAESVAEHLIIFERLFTTDNQPPFSTGSHSSVRAKQAVKQRFSDPSLGCTLLKVTPESLPGDLANLSFLFEALR